MSRVILLGAGASKGTLRGQAPVAAEFGKYLNDGNSDWRQKYPYLAPVIRFLKRRIPHTSEESWALDKVWGAIDNRVKLQHILDLRLPEAPCPPPTTKSIYEIYENNRDHWGAAGFELRCAIAHVYGEELDAGIQQATEGNGTVKTEIEQLQPGDCVISFNYDLLAERILERLTKKVAKANSWLDITNANDAILLCKPHGSLNWRQWSPECGKEVQILDAPMKEDEIDFRPAQNATVQPGIAGPVPFKSEIISPEFQLRSVPNFFWLLVAQWRFAIECLSEAEKLVVLGYGFPPEDLHARYLFAEAAAKRESNKGLETEVYEKCEQSFAEVKERIDELLGPSSCKYLDCKYKGPVEP